MVDQDGTGRISREGVLELLKVIGEALTQMLGEWCEVVVHDLEDLEHCIVSITGNVTGRKVGGHMTDLGLALLRSGQTEPLTNYTGYTDDGKTLKCSTIFVHDENGEPFADLCINLDVTPLLLLDRFVRGLISHSQEPDVAESFFANLDRTVQTVIAQATSEVGKPISFMTKGDRIKMVSLLDERGVFQLRKSVPLIAECLGVTEKTIYNYLNELATEKS